MGDLQSHANLFLKFSQITVKFSQREKPLNLMRVSEIFIKMIMTDITLRQGKDFWYDTKWKENKMSIFICYYYPRLRLFMQMKKVWTLGQA